MSNTTDKVKEGFHDAAEKVKDVAHDAGVKVKDVAHDAGVKVTLNVFTKGSSPMLSYAIVFAILALVAGLVGFMALSGTLAMVATEKGDEPSAAGPFSWPQSVRLDARS